MKKFKINEKVIEAEQWFYGKDIEGVKGDTEDLTGGNGLSPQPAMAFVVTRKGMQKVYEGDLVVKLPNGKKSIIDFEVLELLALAETPVKVAKIVEGENVFYTDNLSHPKAQSAEIIEMSPSEYKSIPATMESTRFFNA